MSKRKNNPARWSERQKVYDLAERARLTAILISEEISKHGGQLAAYLAPIGVVGSWTLELYLKCLHFDEGKRVTDTHDLAILFGQLSAEAQDDIRRIHGKMQDVPHKRLGNSHLERMTGIPITFDRDLDSCRDAFVRVRYLYESDNVIANFGDVVESVRSRINVLHPDWLQDIRDR